MAFSAAMTMPSGTLVNGLARRSVTAARLGCGRIQGYDIGLLVGQRVGEHIAQGRRYYSRTTCPRTGAARDASPIRPATRKSQKERKAHWSELGQPGARRCRSGRGSRGHAARDLTRCGSPARTSTPVADTWMGSVAPKFPVNSSAPGLGDCALA